MSGKTAEVRPSHNARHPVAHRRSPPSVQDPAWKNKEKAEEEQYARAKVRRRRRPAPRHTTQLTHPCTPRDASQEVEALKAIRDELAAKQPAKSELDKDIEGGYGGQEDLEDRYATTLGMH
ncbi:hypothetical protein BN946_scf185002.g85 [Trametes cinnabarina]|uniref:Uncharacterized protein n=1 Tax=Pycnoporus cinnabarinus TaxID=5643 RepID=A0A060SEW2_PYCCI|nr:hypothetical protein BN946_scf185002.g85 [Trametes cinnabarina]